MASSQAAASHAAAPGYPSSTTQQATPAGAGASARAQRFVDFAPSIAQEQYVQRRDPRMQEQQSHLQNSSGSAAVQHQYTPQVSRQAEEQSVRAGSSGWSLWENGMNAMQNFFSTAPSASAQPNPSTNALSSAAPAPTSGAATQVAQGPTSMVERANQLLDMAKDGKWVAVQQLLASHPDLMNFKPPYRNFYVLHQAVWWKQTDVVTDLLRLRADPHLRSKDNLLPIDVARQRGFASIVELLQRATNSDTNHILLNATQLPRRTEPDNIGPRIVDIDPAMRRRPEARDGDQGGVADVHHSLVQTGGASASASSGANPYAMGTSGSSASTNGANIAETAMPPSAPAAGGNATAGSPTAAVGDDWFRQLFGFSETKYTITKNRLHFVPAANGRPAVLRSRVHGHTAEYSVGIFERPTLADLRSRGMAARQTFAGRIKVSNEVGDVSEKHADPENRNATFQVASQFNCLEFVDSRAKPEDGVTGYIGDRTQGPACAISCGPAAVFRNYFAPVDGHEGQTAERQINNLADVLEVLRARYGSQGEIDVRGGYTTVDESKLSALDNLLAKLKEPDLDIVRQNLRLGVQSDAQVTSWAWAARKVTDPNQLVTQVFASACSVAYCNATKPESWERFATLVLEACYEATLWAATLNAARHQGAHGSTRVFLTCVGGGVFGNRKEWIETALQRALNEFQDVKLDVRIVSVGGVPEWLRELEDGPPFGAAATAASIASPQSSLMTSTGAVRLQFKEPQQLRYLYVDAANRLHLLMPIAGGDEIGTDNTCKTVVEMQRFWGLSAQSQNCSAVQQLEFYRKELLFDLALLKLSKQADSKAYVRKHQRLDQAERYISVLKELMMKPEMHLLHGSYPIFPTSLSAMVEHSGNMASMVLSPQHPDNVLRLPGVAFTLSRPINEPFAAPFRDKLIDYFQSHPPPNTLERYVFSSDSKLNADDAPTESAFKKMQERLKAFLREHGRSDVGFKCSSLEELKAVALIDFDSMAEVMEWVRQLEDLSAPKVSFFHGVEDPVVVCIMVQFFIGLANLHAKVYCKETRDWGGFCDSCADDGVLVPLVCSCVEHSDPEGALLSFIVNESGMCGVSMSRDVQMKFLERFRVFWVTVKESPHLDEFIVLFKDVYGSGVCHQGCICVSFAEFAVRSGMDSTGDMKQSYACFYDLEKACKGGYSLRHNNSEQVVELSSNFIEVKQEDLMAEIARRSAKHVAELLLANEEGPEGNVPLYVRFLGSTAQQEPLKEWPKVKRWMLSMMPDQEALDAFSKYEESSHTWCRITGYIARSLYTEASSTVNGALEQLSSLSNQERPDKLHRALQLLGIQVEVDNIQMSEFYDGYTVHLSLAQSELIRAMHNRQRQSFHLTKEMAILVYEQVARRYGETSKEYSEMNKLSNLQRIEVPNPRHRRGRILAPPKMFRALALLGIVIPRWEFNHYNGYIVRADADTLDNLERELEQAEQESRPSQEDAVESRGARGGRGAAVRHGGAIGSASSHITEQPRPELGPPPSRAALEAFHGSSGAASSQGQGEHWPEIGPEGDIDDD